MLDAALEQALPGGFELRHRELLLHLLQLGDQVVRKGPVGHCAEYMKIRM
jgi:hypothetical protein